MATSALTWTFQGALNSAGLGDTFWVPALPLFVGITPGLDPTYAFWTSPDGVAWTSHSTTGLRVPARLTFNQTLGLLVAIGIGDDSNHTVCWSSTDGATWTRTVDGQGMSTRMLATSEDLGIFICGGTGAQPFHSTDGHTWTAGSQMLLAGQSGNVDDAVWSPSLGLFCAIVDGFNADAVSATSTDGSTWTVHTWAGHGTS